WLGVSSFGFIFLLLLVMLHREQPNLFRVRNIPTAPPTSDAIRLSFWNVMSFNRGKDGIAEGFIADDADIICLVEGTYHGQVHDSLSRALGSGYKWMSVPQMAV